MRALPFLIVLLLAGAVLAKEEVPPDSRVSVRSDHLFDLCYVGQAVDLQVTITFSKSFFDNQAVSLFRRDMDVPLHVRVPWLSSMPGARRLLSSDPDAGHGLRFALNSDIVAQDAIAEMELDGEKLIEIHEFQVGARLAPTSPGTIDIPPVVVRFAYATRFEEDFVGGKVALDRKDVTVTTNPFPVIDVLPLPEEGKPPDFSGAVGRFSIAAKADESSFAQDGMIRLTLRFEGHGNFETWPAPHLELDGFHVYGVSEKKAESRRTITYEIAPTSPDATAMPPIPFAFFDPDREAYQVVRTESIPLQVRAPPGSTPEVPGPAPVGEEAPEAPRSLVRRMIPSFVMWCIGAVLAFALRRRGDRVRALAASAVTEAAHADAEAARAARRSQATEALHANLGGGQALDAFAEFLAAHLDVTSAAVIAPDLADRLQAAGVPDELATSAAATLEQGTAARYGGPASQAPALDAALVAALQEALGSD